MPRGDKDKYSNKQKREAQHIEEGYEDRGTPKKEAERRAWATVNKMHGGGEKGGKAVASRPASERSASAKKAAETRKRHESEK